MKCKFRHFFLKKNLLKWISILKSSLWTHLKELDIMEEWKKFCATVKSILQAFSSLCMVESKFSFVHYLLSTLNIECGDL